MEIGLNNALITDNSLLKKLSNKLENFLISELESFLESLDLNPNPNEISLKTFKKILLENKLVYMENGNTFTIPDILNDVEVEFLFNEDILQSVLYKVKLETSTLSLNFKRG